MSIKDLTGLKYSTAEVLGRLGWLRQRLPLVGDVRTRGKENELGERRKGRLLFAEATRRTVDCTVGRAAAVREGLLFLMGPVLRGTAETLPSEDHP